MDVSESDRRNTEQIRRAQADPDASMKAARAVLSEPPPLPSPNHGAAWSACSPTFTLTPVKKGCRSPRPRAMPGGPTIGPAWTRTITRRRRSRRSPIPTPTSWPWRMSAGTSCGRRKSRLSSGFSAAWAPSS
jgi:hypothetical protein